MVHKVQVVISPCLIADAFAEKVKVVCEAMGFQINEIEIVRIEFGNNKSGEDLFRQYNLANRCRHGYCPGCNHHINWQTDIHYLPALIIDGVVESHSALPKRDKILEIFSRIKKIEEK